ncbi:alpha/beta fold hydrolase [uncultured Thiothrix sp.]|uniref:alpha/beta fold hydrolase n=1 Tax=uncultured Thiothrix sp. TaxID=223185 RepID=UPI00261CD2E3|nr:alpha/beta fold hydrolase [uncultured Thiothrix sp.]
MSTLSVDHGHIVYFAEFGNPQGIPLLFMHGGPGSGCNPAQANLLYPEGFRIIQLDQRGCGKSIPLACLEANTTADLVEDMERLRSHLNIERWVIYGGSWGTVLALEYAKRFPERTLGVLLRGVFLARREDWSWFALPDGVSKQFPAAYQALLASLQIYYHTDPARVLLERLQTEPEHAYQAALAWDAWEAAIMQSGTPSFNPDPHTWFTRIARMRVYAHYAANHFFLPPHGVLDGLDKLGDIPVWAVHGKQDQVCRISGAELLRQSIKNYHLLMVDAGHGMYESALQQALSRLAVRIYEILRVR